MALLRSNYRLIRLSLAMMMLVLPGSTLLAQKPQCGFRTKHIPVAHKAASDCGQAQSVIRPEYQPGDMMTIRTVVHVIHRVDGEGKLDEAAVRTQIATLNRDFRAPNAAANGHGKDAGIEFQLATEDPGGNATNGIVSAENDDWFAGELAEYGEHLVWDPRPARLA